MPKSASRIAASARPAKPALAFAARPPAPRLLHGVEAHDALVALFDEDFEVRREIKLVVPSYRARPRTPPRSS